MIDMKNSLKTMVFIQILMVVAIVLDVYIVRQIFGFIYLTFLPGYLFIKLLKIDFKEKLDVLLFSFGISIGFTMMIGLLINEVYPLLGIQQPLSILSILITLSFIQIILIIINHKHDFEFSEETTFFEFKKSHLKFLILVIPPLSGIIGAIYQSTYFLSIMIFTISVIFLLLAFIKKNIPQEMYPFIIYSISIALIFHTILISKYLIGNDVNIEYQVFKITKMNSIWNASYFRNVSSYEDINNYNAMLSTTILPTIYALFLNIKEDLYFKIVSPLFMSLIPVMLYKFYKTQFSSLIAIFSVFFFMSDHTTFFGVNPINLNRQIIAEIFFILSILVLFNYDIDKRKRQFLFLFFGSLVLFSHYAAAYIYIFYLIFVYIFLGKKLRRGILNSTSIVFLLLIKLTWDVFISIRNVWTINYLLHYLYNRLFVDFLNPSKRPSELQWLYSSQTVSIITQLHRVIFYIVNLLLAFGILVTFLHRKKSNIDKKYYLLMLFGFINIVLAIVIPNVIIFSLLRFRIFAMLFLTPAIIIGCKSILNWITRTFIKGRSYIRKNDIHIKVVSLILVLYFLFNIGFINHVMDVKPISTPLDIDRKKISNDLQVLTNFYDEYIQEQDYFSTVWLSNNVDDASVIYSDDISRWHVLHSYGMFSSDRIQTLRNNTELTSGDYVYLSHLNYVDGVITLRKGTVSAPYFDISEITLQLEQSNKVYSNGDSEIYYDPKS